MKESHKLLSVQGAVFAIMIELCSSKLPVYLSKMPSEGAFLRWNNQHFYWKYEPWFALLIIFLNVLSLIFQDYLPFIFRNLIYIWCCHLIKIFSIRVIWKMEMMMAWMMAMTVSLLTDLKNRQVRSGPRQKFHDPIEDLEEKNSFFQALLLLYFSMVFFGRKVSRISVVNLDVRVLMQVWCQRTTVTIECDVALHYTAKKCNISWVHL